MAYFAYALAVVGIFIGFHKEGGVRLGRGFLADVTTIAIVHVVAVQFVAVARE